MKDSVDTVCNKRIGDFRIGTTILSLFNYNKNEDNFLILKLKIIKNLQSLALLLMYDVFSIETYNSIVTIETTNVSTVLPYLLAPF